MNPVRPFVQRFGQGRMLTPAGTGSMAHRNQQTKSNLNFFDNGGNMKEFIAAIEERYTWECPYCKEMCDDTYDDPDGEVRECEHCQKESKCKYTQR